MSTTTGTTATAATERALPGAAPPAPGGAGAVAKVHVPARSLRGELRAVRIVWQRELIRFSRDRLRMVTQLVQPFLFLFILGTGLAPLASAGTHGVSFRTFVYPGVLCMAVLFTAMFSAASIVWDREFGFLREMMVAPVRRSSLVLGKCLGGATVAALEGAIVVAIAPLVGVPYTLTLVLAMLGLQLLLALMITAFGVMVAARVTQMQSFMALIQMAIMPMFFISGAMFPTNTLPRWLEVLNRLDPLTYAVVPMRKAVFAHLSISDAARSALDPPLTWFGYAVPTGVCLAVVALLGVAMLGVAIVQFSRVE
ncbi:MAG: ABC transporter permease [Solirubrobacterales bacterium]|nr:ABC transporter permease [Solirubrobacterales bacterium]